MARSQTTQRVNKKTFLNAVVCPTRGWLTRNQVVEPSEADQLRMAEGREVGRRAQLRFPGGTLVNEVDLTADAHKTQVLMDDPQVAAIFEATLLIDQYAARADTLVRDGKGWKVIEVKSGINPNQEYVEDLAYTLMVAAKAGTTINAASLLLLNGSYRLGQDETSLFAEHDMSEEAIKTAGAFDASWEAVPASALVPNPPQPALIFACRKCPHFREQCFGGDEKNHIFDLPGLREPLFDILNRQNVTRIADIPLETRLTPAQKRVRTAVATGRPVIAKRALAEFLSLVEWPAFYLDFETVKSAIPLFPNVGPHEQLVTQYSLHLCTTPGEITDHHEFLADPSGDQRRELAERLLQDLKDHGSIVVYSSFEKTMLNGLAKLFPDLSDRLSRCVDRLFDLEKAFRNHYYDPRFGGRTSIKATLPALVGLTYDGLQIGNGDMAVARFAKMIRGEIVGSEAEATRSALLEYCKQDTHGMVLLHSVLVEKCRKPSNH